ncbi:MAG: 50S ribosomal protein L4, partial [Planctomycetota bacterium]
HHARTRGEVSGTNKKMYRQKGTGNARAGSKRTNVRRGGGVARTIKPRDYSYRLPKKAVRLATRMAIASKINDHQACVIDGLALDAPRTKPVASFLAAIGLAGESVLIVTGQHDPVVYRSARNIEGVEVQEVRQLNALGLLRPKMVVFTKDAIQRVKDGTFADATDSVSAG